MLVIIGERSKAVADGSRNLCPSCRNYFSYTYALNNQIEHFCSILQSGALRMKGPVSRCSDWSDKNQPYRSDMEKMAWILEVSHKTVGFGGERNVKVIAPSDRKDAE